MGREEGRRGANVAADIAACGPPSGWGERGSILLTAPAAVVLSELMDWVNDNVRRRRRPRPLPSRGGLRRAPLAAGPLTMRLLSANASAILFLSPVRRRCADARCDLHGVGDCQGER